MHTNIPVCPVVSEVQCGWQTKINWTKTAHYMHEYTSALCQYKNYCVIICWCVIMVMLYWEC